MLTVLIADDNPHKSARIISALEAAVGKVKLRVERADSTSTSIRMMEAHQFHLLILDLNIPSRTGESPRQDGGLRILRQLTRVGTSLKCPLHIIGLTAYPDLLESFREEFTSESWHLINYDDASDDWSDMLAKKVTYIISSLSLPDLPSHRYDLAIVTALKPVELEAILHLPVSWNETSLPSDDTYYHTATITKADSQYRIVAAAAYEMGMSASACLAMKMIEHFRPRFLAMAGICAGVNANFGDIVLAEHSWDYGSGKIKTTPKQQTLFAPAPSQIPVDTFIKERAEYFRSHRKHILSAIRDRWTASPPAHSLSLHIGPVASGAAVVENQPLIDSILAHNRKLIGIEMETYGVYLASRLCSAPRPVTFSAKAVSDFGKPPKNDEYQRYAAFTSAHFIYEFALDQLL